MNIAIKKFDELSIHTLYAILKLRVDVFVVEQNCPYPEIDGVDQESMHFFIESEATIKAYLRTYTKFKGCAAIGRVITHADYRKDGLGKKLMSEAMAYLQKQEEITTVYLQAQEHLSGFYASFGFKITSKSYLEDGIPHVDMEYYFNS